MVRTLVITSCTGEKKAKPYNQLVKENFLSPGQLREREAELKHLSCPAAEMYTGAQHLRLMEGVSMLREHYGSDVVNLGIVSAGYGLISENRPIVPYEVTFNDMTARETVEWSRFLNIHSDLSEFIKGYDLIFFLLGDKYLRSLELPLGTIGKGQQLIFLSSKTSKKLIPNEKPYYFIEVGKKEASSFSYGLVGLKGFLFKLLAQEIVVEGEELLNRIYSNPECSLDLLVKYRKNSNAEEVVQQSLFPKVEKEQNKRPQKKDKPKVDFWVPEEQYAKNYGHSVKYFIPEWDDRVDPEYDFLTDTTVKGRDTHLHDVYAHEIYDDPNYDGILVSKVKVEESKKKKALIEEMGLQRFLRFDTNRPVMGDCGAFGYIEEHEPPYHTEEILDYYERLGFDIGVSIDHLIVGDFAKDPEERNRRFKITQDNAREFIDKYKDGNYSFTPSGIAQGWDPDSYREAVVSLIDMGYEHISLGGLARTPTKQILEIMRAIAPIVPEYLRIHLFGVARLDAVESFRKLGITSFDSASHLRQAWLGSGSNYFAMDGNKYAAIRVPPVDGHNVRVRKMINEGRGTEAQFKLLQNNALEALRKYDREELNVEDTLQAVLAYDSLIGDKREKHMEMYRRVLEDRPWKKCDCKICRDIGIEVIIFRGNNRNRRRGFHNTYVFYKQFKEKCPN